MRTLLNITPLKNLVAKWRQENKKIAFVPTMGNLHEGHLSLVNKAQSVADKVIVSIYVNPLQFGVNEDFDSYPRTMDVDSSALKSIKTDVLFLPNTEMLYPRSPEKTTRIEVPELSDILCGAHRPGHFIGVTTVVCKLLNLVTPDIMLLGEKDYQQVAVIRQMVEDLNIPVEIATGETVREQDGLAKSSRNQYLSLKERKIAPILYKTLKDAAERALGGEKTAIIERESINTLSHAGLKVDYFEFRQAANLEKPSAKDKSLVILAAAYLGKTRLIDNLALTLH